MKDNRFGAVAVGYKKTGTAAPKILAKGQGELAARIIEIARENGITIREDKLLYESLSRLETGDEIPVKLYRAVAEVLAFVYSINDTKKSII